MSECGCTRNEVLYSARWEWERSARVYASVSMNDLSYSHIVIRTTYATYLWSCDYRIYRTLICAGNQSIDSSHSTWYVLRAA